MIVFSAGMPKAGTGWIFNLTHDLGLLAGWDSVRELRERHSLEFLAHGNCYIGSITNEKLEVLLRLHLKGKRFVVKAHDPPSTLLIALLRRGIVRATYSFRDPRDVVASALDYGKLMREKQIQNPFAELDSFDKAVGAARYWVATAHQWMSAPGVLAIRYEDMLSDAVHELGRVAAYLDMDVSRQSLESCTERYLPENHRQKDTARLHFHRGVVGRHREVLSAEQVSQLDRVLGPFLEEHGYAVAKPPPQRPAQPPERPAPGVATSACQRPAQPPERPAPGVATSACQRPAQPADPPSLAAAAAYPASPPPSTTRCAPVTNEDSSLAR